MEGDDASWIAAAASHPTRRGVQGRHRDFKNDREDHGTESQVGEGADSSSTLK